MGVGVSKIGEIWLTFDSKLEEYNTLMKTLTDVDLSNVIEIDDNTNLSGELACAGGSCEIS